MWLIAYHAEVVPIIPSVAQAGNQEVWKGLQQAKQQGLARAFQPAWHAFCAWNIRVCAQRLGRCHRSVELRGMPPRALTHRAACR